MVGMGVGGGGGVAALNVLNLMWAEGLRGGGDEKI